MSEKNAGGGPNWALLLLVPVGVIVAKGMMHRRAMWESGWTPSGPGGGRRGHHGRFGGEMDAARGSFRLPPRIEWMLDTWHTRAHETTGSTEAKSPTEPESTTI